MKGLNIYMMVNQTGWGVHALQWALALSKILPVKVVPLVQQFVPPRDQIRLEPLIQRPLFSEGADLYIFPMNYVGEMKPSRRFAIWTTVFETTAPKDLSQLKAPWISELWTVSPFCAQVLRHHNFHVPIRVVPEGFDPSVFAPGVVPMLARRAGRVRVFSGGRFERRKGQDLVLSAFAKLRQEFPVDLITHWANDFHPDYNFARMIAMAGLSADFIHESPRVEQHADMARIYASCDMAVFPARAEGWNLPLCEFMATVGGPVVATDYSGHQAFINDAVAYGVRVKAMVPASDGLWFKPAELDQGLWAEPDGEHFLEQWRKALALCMNATLLTEHRTTVLAHMQNYTWDRAAAVAAGFLQEHI